MKALAILLKIGYQRRSINKKPFNPCAKQIKKTERSRLGFWNSRIALSMLYFYKNRLRNSVI